MSKGFFTAYTPEPVKFSELRAKTDQQLHDLIHSKLKVGLAALAEVEASVGDRAHAEGSLERADQALAEVDKLLPALNEDQRRAFDPKLNELREALDRLGRNRELPRSHTASMF